MEKSLSRQRPSSGLPPPRRLPRDGPLALSFAQERLWFIDRLAPGSATYNIPALAFRLRGALNGMVLRRALDELARRHEALRTAFPEVDGRPVQVIAPPGPFPLPLVDLSALPPAARGVEASALARAELARPFDLARGPLTRAFLARLAGDEHTFLLTQHHIVSDGWSVGILQQELAALYTAFAAGQPSPLPELPLQPADAAQWQRDHLQGDALARLLGWWKEHLGGSFSLLELPTDHPRPAMQSFRGGHIRFALGRKAGAALRELAVRERITPFMTLLAAFQALLCRVTGQTGFLVGFPVAGRAHQELEGLVGFFVNTLVVRTRAGDDPAFSDLLRRVRGDVLDAMHHQDLPFERLVEELQPERALSHTPLVQALFTFRQASAGELRLPGLTLVPEGTGGTETAKFDLLFTADEGSAGVSASFEYDRDLFEPPTIHRLALGFQRILEAALERPRTRLSGLPLLGGAERHQLLVEWNDTRRRDPGALVHDLFAGQARAAPDAPALVFQGEVTTYGELAARAGCLARRLRSLGAGPESRVGVVMERSPELIVALLGVLQVGGAYVPLDPAQPRERRLALLRECGARVLLTQPALAEGCAGFEGPVLSLPVEPEPGEPLDRGATPVGVTPENLAYVIFTSGSTGKPKGVAVPHRAVVRLVRDAGYADFGPEQVFLQLSPVSFDASTFEIWGCLLHGGRLVIHPPGLPALAELGAIVRREGVTTLWLTAGLFHSMVEERIEGLAGLSQLLAGGDVLSPAHVRRALAALPGTRLIDGYGPTECTTFACCHSMTAADPPAGPVPIGRPIGNTRAYVVEAGMRPVPIGVPGDLLLGGDGLARGYEADPALSAGRFVPDPFAALSGERGGRLYRTGDRARWRPDGRLEFLGRGDEQVKIRGFRIEPAEIETALSEHPDVAEAAVVVEGRDAHSRRLVAFVVPRPGGRRPPGREIRDWLKERLPLYLVPAAVATVDGLPLTPNGKVDRRALAARAGEAARTGTPRGLEAPRTDLERRLAGIWTGLLRVDSLGVHDNFFDLGGDSLLAIQMVSRAGRAGISLSLRQLFRHQTVAELAAAVEAAPAVRAEQGWVTGPVPMTPGQVWFFDRVAGNLRAPHELSSKAFLEFREPVPAAAVARAVARVIFQHDALRLRVSRCDGVWEQHDAGPEAIVDSWAHADLSALPEPAQDAAIPDVARQLLGRGDLEGPLSRFLLFTLGPERPARLLILLHHLVSDGPSWSILREDLETALRQAAAGEEIDLPPKTTSFRAWALRQEELARSEDLRGQVDFWLRLARAGGQTLPADFLRGGAGTGEVGQVSVTLDADATRVLLQDLPAALGARFTDAVLTAVVRAFARWTGSGSLLLRQTLHGRDPVFDDVDLSRTVGWISTTAPVLLELDGTEPPAEALASIAAQIERVPLRGLGYGLLRYMTGDPGIAGRMAAVAATPAATFNFLGRFGGDRAAPGLLADIPLDAGSANPIPRRDPQLRITAVLGGNPARLMLSWDYGGDFYRRETIERLAESCLEELRKLIDL
jgi:amino acid adenylation domain-containing protein/non-ribosomal peptide synthase protein (TIGR01720 family)